MRRAAAKAVMALTSADVCEVTIKPHKLTRSQRQNRYYWGVVIKTLSDFTGDDAEATHKALSEMFLHGEKVTALGIEVMVYPSTTKLNTKEFSAFVDAIRHFAMHDYGVYIPEVDKPPLDEVD